ncbi:helix-turn-helix transcriptional regulator [Parasphingorhabdus pacifica]
MRQVGEKLGWSESKVSRVELAQHKLSETDLSSVLAILGVTGTEREKLLKLARDINQPAWWEFGLDLSPQLTALLDAEQRAVRITQCALHVLPGLLQTRPYSRALFHGFHTDSDEIDRHINVRQLRQGILYKQHPVELAVYLDESVLQRPVGGPQVMSEQLRHLHHMSLADNIALRIMPISAGAHTGLQGTFVLLDFVRDRSIVHVEQRHASAFFDDAEDVAPFKSAADDLRKVAIPRSDSTELIADYVRRHEREVE